MMLKSNSDIFNQYLAHLQVEKGIAESTRTVYLNAAEKFYAFLHAQPESLLLAKAWDWASVNRRAVEMYFNHLRGQKGWQEVSIRQQASALRYFFRYLRERGHIQKDPIKNLFPRVTPDAPQIPEGEEDAVLALFSRQGTSLSEARLLALLELIYGGGIRPTQVYRLSGITVSRGRVSIEDGPEQRELPLSPDGVNRLKHYLELRKEALAPKGPAPLWVNSRGSALSASGLARAIRKAMEGVGLNGGARVLRQLSARHFRERGGDIRSLKQFLGMKRMGSLERFGETEFQNVRARFLELHPRGQDT